MRKIKFYDDTDKMLDVCWNDIDDAKDFIFVCTYEMDDSLIANICIDKLCYASERGVKVYLIIEDLNAHLTFDQIQKLEKAGCHYVLHSPISKFYEHILDLNPRRFFNRNHQKIMLIDNNVHISSQNLSSRYSSQKYGSLEFRDMAVVIRDYQIQPVLDFFRNMIVTNKRFNSHIDVEQFDKDLVTYREKYCKDNAEDKMNIFLREEPPSRTEVSTTLIEIIDNAQHSIQIIQPYYLPIQDVDDAILKALERGVKVEIITARKRDQPCYKAFLNGDLFLPLIQKGAHLYEEPFTYLHMKTTLVDNRVISIGSMNFDECSFFCNNEANFQIKTDPDSKVMMRFKQAFEKVRGQCVKVDPDEQYSWYDAMECRFWRSFMKFTTFVSRNR